MNAPAEYELKYHVRFIEKLGDGKDGRVAKTNEGQAVKFLLESEIYRRELRAYHILRIKGIDDINGFQIPRLIRSDDALRAIEMSIVRPPFILDFAAAYTIEEHDRFAFDEDVVQERESHWAEIFGDRWAAVQTICNEFTSRTGLILLDLSLNNIRFE
jgi:hypothetical protein